MLGIALVILVTGVDYHEPDLLGALCGGAIFTGMLCDFTLDTIISVAMILLTCSVSDPLAPHSIVGLSRLPGGRRNTVGRPGGRRIGEQLSDHLAGDRRSQFLAAFAAVAETGSGQKQAHVLAPDDVAQEPKKGGRFKCAQAAKQETIKTIIIPAQICHSV